MIDRNYDLSTSKQIAALNSTSNESRSSRRQLILRLRGDENDLSQNSACYESLHCIFCSLKAKTNGSLSYIMEVTDPVLKFF